MFKILESESDGRSKASFIPEHIAFTPVQENKPPLVKTDSPCQSKVSVEDFLSGEKTKTEKSRKMSESDKKLKSNEDAEHAKKGNLNHLVFQINLTHA